MNTIRGLLFDNLGLKFVSLLLAIVVYLNVYTDRPATAIVSFPLEFIGLPDTLTLSGPAPAVVQAEVRGTGKQIIGLRVKEPRMQLSLSGVERGRYERAIVASDLPLPPGSGMTVENLVGPRMIQVDVDRRVERLLPVAASVEGQAAPGFAWTGEVSFDPSRIVVRGPAGVLAKMDTVRLGALRLDGKRDTVRAGLQPESLPDWCIADPPVVRVKVALVRTAR